MSDYQIIPHFAERYAEARIVGHEDWQSAVETIEDVREVLERERWDRLLLNMSEAVIRVSAHEALDLAAFLNNLFVCRVSVAVVPPVATDIRAEEALRAFAGAMTDYGHAVCYLGTSGERQRWAGEGLRRTGT